MGKTQANTRLDEDTAEILEEHCDEQGTTKAEVLRRATRKYLAEHGHDVAVADGGKMMARLEQMERDRHRANRTQQWAVVALVWMGLEVSFATPALWTIPTGLLIVVTLAGHWFLGWRDGDE